MAVIYIDFENVEPTMDLSASAVMTKDVKTVPPDMKVPVLEEKLLRDRVTGYPVVEGSRLVGVVSRADLIRQLDLERSIVQIAADYYGQDAASPRDDWIAETTGQQVDQLVVRDVMSPYLIKVLPTEPLHRVAKVMATERVHRVLVTQGEKLVGVISAFDFVKLYSKKRIGMTDAPFAGTDDF